MTTATQKKNEITQPQVYQIDYGSFFVESSDGLKLYKVNVDGDKFCSCPDYAKNSKSDPNYQCKHIRAVLNAEESKIFKFQSLQQNVKPKLDEHFIKNIQGKDFVLYAGLLDLSHQKGLQKLEVKAIQYPTKENGYEAICRAVATSKTGEMFVDYGDANPKNCNKMIAQHVLRMASTRSKSRVLRDFTNVGMTALEELGEISDVLGNDNGNPKKTRGRKTSSTKAKTETNPPESSPPPEKKEPVQSTEQKASEANQNDTKPRMSEAQKRAVQNLAKRRGISEEQLEEMAVEKYGIDLENLSSSDAASFIRNLQQTS
ncbi:MAG TPA: SWIM zinc finger family protein [bacterium]|nr:SWIM zinc finger family protein [bacterium]